MNLREREREKKNDKSSMFTSNKGRGQKGVKEHKNTK